MADSFLIPGFDVFVTPDRMEPAVRAWRERLFTRPWHPTRKYKSVVARDQQIYRMANNRLLVPRSMVEKLREAIAAANAP